MKNVFLLMGILSLLNNGSAASKSPGPERSASKNFNRSTGLSFTENKGQIASLDGTARPDILYTATSGGAQVFISANKIYYQFTHITAPSSEKQRSCALVPMQTYRFNIELLDAAPDPMVSREGESGDFRNYYLDQCPDGIKGVKSFQRITFHNVYPHIDWVLYSKEDKLKYDFVLHPGADPRQIRIRIKDADHYFIDKEGALIMQTRLGEVREAAPVAFEEGRPVASSFFQAADGTIGFHIEPPKDKTITLDPSVAWSTYYNFVYEAQWYSGTATDASGHVYLAGISNSATGIASSGFQNTLGGSYDAVLAKFDSAGNRLWATYYGGAGNDNAYNCATDNLGNVYIVGNTSSTTAIAANGYQNTLTISNASSAFAAKFNDNGTRLWGTYYSGSNGSVGIDIKADANGNVYLLGSTLSDMGIATSGTYDNTLNGFSQPDAFVVKFNSNCTRIWGTYFGGTDMELPKSLAIDPSGNIYFSGMTSSASGIASTGAQQTTYNGGLADAFLCKLDTTGNRLWSTYYGGNGEEWAATCGTDAAGNVYLTSATSSTSSIASNGYQNTFGAGQNDLFAVKFNTAGVRQWGTYYGTNTSSMYPPVPNLDNSFGSTVDGAGNLYLTGMTNSSDSFAVNAFQPNIGGQYDAFLVKFNTTGALSWASYFGGTKDDYGYNCAVDPFGYVYLSGVTNSNDGIATTNGFQNSYTGTAMIAFLTRIDTLGTFTATIDSLPDTLCAGTAITVPYTAVGNFQAGNIFTLQMSDASSSFTTPVTVGSLAATASGSITGTIPATTPTGILYKFRIVSSAPAMSINYPSPELVVIKGVPPAPAAIFGEDSICATSSSVWYIDPTQQAESYSWVLPSGWNGSSDSTHIAIQVGQAGLYTLRVSASNGCFSSDTAAKQVRVLPLPHPVITQNGITLSTGSNYVAYQWLLNNVVIPGAIFNAINPMLYDDYRVIVTDSFGCTDTSDVYTLGPPNGINGPSVQQVQVYPNPVTHKLFIKASSAVTAELSSLDGKRMWYGKYSNKGIDLDAFETGIYFLKIYDEKNNLLGIKKVVKTGY